MPLAARGREAKENNIFFVPQSPTSLRSGVAEGPTGLRRLAAPSCSHLSTPFRKSFAIFSYRKNAHQNYVIMIIVKLEKVHPAKKLKRNDIKMKRGRLKAKFLAVFAALFLIITPAQTSLAIAPSSRNVVSYYSQHLQPKYQQINGPCWAFAGMATLETFLHKKGILHDSLSEKHLLSWANQTSTNYGWHVPITRGGSSIITKGYLMSGIGPVSSRVCPYTTSNDT